jgi:hypothetical protein
MRINVILTIASLVVLFGVLELGFRLVEALGVWAHSSTEGIESWAIYDEDLGYRPRPN